MRARTGSAIVLGGVFVALCAAAIAAAPPASGATTVDGGAGDRWASLGAIGPTDVLTPAAYLPLVYRNFFIPFTYEDSFDNWTSGWRNGTSPFAYGYKHDSDGSYVYHMRMEDEGDLGFVTGPSWVAGNFDYTASIRRSTTEQPKYWYDEFGLLLSPNVVDPAKPVGSGAYTFQIELRIDPVQDSRWVVSRWNSLTRSGRTVLASAPEGYSITDAARVWNELRIVRSGDTMSFYMRRQEGIGWTPWELAHSFTQSGLPYTFQIGFYAYHSLDDLGKYTIEVQFDNVRTSSAPERAASGASPLPRRVLVCPGLGGGGDTVIVRPATGGVGRWTATTCPARVGLHSP